MKLDANGCARKPGAARGVGGCALLGLALLPLLIGVGCARDDRPRLQTRTVSLAEFSRSAEWADAASSPAAATAAATEPPSPAAHTASTTAAAPEQPPAVASSGGMPRPVRQLRPNDEVVVESVIGQVSGRPIFVDEFLGPIADQLRAMGERMNEADFLRESRVVIHNRLMEIVIQELFLAEAEAVLSEQERVGLLALLRDLQERNVAERGGTMFGAQRRIAEEQEMTLEEFQEAQRNAALIVNLLNQRIAPRVIVSWRDVQREYERRRSEFNPPRRVAIHRLQINADQQDLINQLNGLLQRGENFDQIVEQLELRDSVSVLTGQPLEMGPGGVSDVGVADFYKPALAKLRGEVGETTEPIARTEQGRIMWLHIAAIEQPPGRSLFEVQEQLIGELRARRETEERNKYIQSLLEKAIFDELEQMSRRVQAVVLLRYWSRR